MTTPEAALLFLIVACGVVAVATALVESVIPAITDRYRVQKAQRAALLKFERRRKEHDDFRNRSALTKW